MSGSRKDTRRIRDKTLQVNMWTTCQKIGEKHRGDQTLAAKEIRTRGAVEEALEFCYKCTQGINQRIKSHEDYIWSTWTRQINHSQGRTSRRISINIWISTWKPLISLC